MQIISINQSDYSDIMSKNKFYSQYQHPDYVLVDYEGNNHYKIIGDNKEVIGVFRAFKRKIIPIYSFKLVGQYELIIKRAIYFEDLTKQMPEFTKAVKKFMKTENLFLFSVSPAITVNENNLDIPYSLELKDQFLQNDWEYYRPYDFSGRISYYEQACPLDFESEDLLFSSLKKDTKRKIKKANKVGVTIYKHESKSLDEFYDLFEETGIRDGFKIKNLDVYENMLKVFKDKADVYVSVLDLEKYKNHVLANQSDRLDILENIDAESNRIITLGVAIVLNTDYQSYYQSGATSNKFRETMHNYALHYEAILGAYNKGLKTYNFGGVDGSDNKDSSIYTLNMFKTRFASYRVEFIGEFYLFKSKLEQLIYNFKK